MPCSLVTRVQAWLLKRWYRPSADGWSWLLSPFSLLFYLLSALRRFLYNVAWLPSYSVPVPVIVVGNISVGGNGKTPLVLFLANWLSQQGYQPGVLSRGYGGKTQGQLVKQGADATEVGDEPAMLRQHLTGPLVVDANRVRGANTLIEQGCDLILCDDGLQHYRLRRDIEIVVVDGVRRFGNCHLLPMGPLREGLWRLGTADFIVVNGKAQQPNEFAMQLNFTHLKNVKHPARTLALSEITQAVTALAGIGNPERFFELLRAQQVPVAKTLAFDDHHPFSASDIPSGLVLMTEKDAVKCRDLAHDDCWYLPVTAALQSEFTDGLQKALSTLADKKK